MLFHLRKLIWFIIDYTLFCIQACSFSIFCLHIQAMMWQKGHCSMKHWHFLQLVAELHLNDWCFIVMGSLYLCRIKNGTLSFRLKHFAIRTIRGIKHIQYIQRKTSIPRGNLHNEVRRLWVILFKVRIIYKTVH